jgi:hypothetical protein
MDLSVYLHIYTTVRYISGPSATENNPEQRLGKAGMCLNLLLKCRQILGGEFGSKDFGTFEKLNEGPCN